MAEVDENEVDTAEEKAEAIGKELGADKMDATDKEQLPDYEVIEEPESDARIAKEREQRNKSERKELTNKEKRELRKKRLAQKFNEKDEIIERQQRQLDEFASWKNQVEGRLTNVDRTKVDEALNQNIVAFNQAEKDHQAAFTEGDGAKATSAMRIMYNAQKNIDQLQGIKQQYEKAQPQRQVQQTDKPDPVIAKKAKAWAEKHDWYNATGGDEDSEIAKTISGILANEGYDPKTDDFWDELNDRLDARGIGDYENEDEPEEKSIVKRRTNTPPVGGGSRRSDSTGKTRVTLPTAYINACKDAGKWSDDPKDPTRKRMIQRYMDGQKQNQAS